MRLCIGSASSQKLTAQVRSPRLVQDAESDFEGLPPRTAVNNSLNGTLQTPNAKKPLNTVSKHKKKGRGNLVLEVVLRPQEPEDLKARP